MLVDASFFLKLLGFNSINWNGKLMTELVPYDDRDGQIWVDGSLIPWREAKLHVLSHALHYASCVFEGERVYSGKIYKLNEHSARLCESAAELGFEIPYTIKDINAATKAVVSAENIDDA